ncbi:VacJ family lipoprotein [Thiococcus pfennigii]|uniref:MlaA family lipoprotein n=1 Tax=Thiococcus pfennigii TaxID=1057 RepID=UPI001906D313|nr:VacJ family lipoprotein [Thiococcus pfennigii]MBK1701297.1 ABC transporter [Thiococcus pfennigii]MBK1732505.1 ABC transporter [Thiococcus pfennigii]
MRTGYSIGLCALAVVLLASGCASTPEELRDPRDPWESVNRGVYKFNTDFDNAFMKPIAKGYQAVTPEPVDRGVTNFFGNLADVDSAVNNLLQFKLARAGSDVGRVIVNSTVGILGFVDVASNMGIPSYKEDFGQTLGYWGIGSGPYLMLPILGPSSVRDTVGFAGDIVVDPLFNVRKNEIYWGAIGLRAVDGRADLLTAESIFEEAAIDRYIFLRDAYLQRRDAQVNDSTLTGDAAPDIWDDEDVGPIGD